MLKKAILFILLISTILMSSGAAASYAANAAAASVAAAPTASTVIVDGRSIIFDAYNIADFNYFKLRDLAYTLNGTEKQFEVGWDEANNAISLTKGLPYTTVGGEMTGKGSGAKIAAPTDSRIFLDGALINFTAYLIEGNNYFKLRDIGEAFDFGVDWDGDRDTIVIDTKKGYTPAESGAAVTSITNGSSTATISNASDKPFYDYLANLGYKSLTSKTYTYDILFDDDGFPMPMDFTMPAGIIGAMSADFDGDGSSEMLVILSEQRMTEYDDRENIFMALMLKEVDGQVKETARCELSNNVVSFVADTGFTDVFVENRNGVYVVGCETENWHSFWADGIEWQLAAYKYADGAFVNIAEYYIAGSSFENGELDEVAEQVSSARFYIKEPFDRIYESNDRLNALCRIDYEYTGDNDEFYDIAFGGAGGTLAPISIKILIPGT